VGRKSNTAWLIGLALCVSGCGSSSTAPTQAPAPTPTVTVTSLTIGGSANLLVSQISPLTAVATYSNGFTSLVTSGATWQSLNTTVASVSTSGLVTATAGGTTAITATFGARTASVNITVSTTGQIVSCGTFTGPGPFVVRGDLANMAPPCLNFSNSITGQLDCQGHDVSSVTLSGVQGFAIRNCLMHGTTMTSLGVLRNLSVMSSARVTIDSSDELGQVVVEACQGCTFSNDTFVYPMAGFTPSGGSYASCEICLDNGQGNTVSQSTIDGGWTGSGQQPVDDGIGFNSEGNLTLRGNTIRNVFDAGIEGGTSPGPVTATIQGNTITRAGFTGIGGYYLPGWQNSVFSGNTVSNAPNLWFFVHAPSASAGVTAMTLVNNQFVSNTFTSPSPQGVGNAALIDYVNGGLPYTVQGNLVQNNNFGTGPGPLFSPVAGFIDGGGNICGSGGNLLSCGGGRALSSVPRAAWILFRKPPSRAGASHLLPPAGLTISHAPRP